MRYPPCCCQYCGADTGHYQQEYCSQYCKDKGDAEKEKKKGGEKK